MSILQAIVYGIIQGIGEFLPISSTAHLILLPWLFEWKDPGVVFDVALHLGTASAVILFFAKDWVRIISAGFTKPKSQDGKLFWCLVLATIPGGLFGVLLDKYMESFRNAALIGIMLIVMGIILYLADRYGKKVVHINETGAKRSLFIGAAQVFAVVPGISRSGITITAGRLLGMTRESIARLTFLMSAPIILGDALYHAKDLVNSTIDKAPFLTAMITAAVAGTLSIKFLLNYLKSKGFGLFAIYRCILGVLVIVAYFLR